jgi:hypothetical protein
MENSKVCLAMSEKRCCGGLGRRKLDTLGKGGESRLLEGAGGIGLHTFIRGGTI